MRAIKINSGFERKDGTTLVILDDFPTKSKPQDIGIPYERKRCKVLLTTRDEADCINMGCDHLIPLEPLSGDEALSLLQKLSGVNPRSDLFYMAQEIAFTCNGLPGLIKDVVSSLQKKSLEKWEESLVSLSHSKARYQIFISFRGMDTREIFTRHLYDALCKEGFYTFKDDQSLEGGAPIEELLEAIEESRFAIVVLSKNFADSKWCLTELVKILDCRKRKKQLVLPIFYEVEPTDIRHLKGRSGEAMAEHEKELGKDSKTVLEWTHALRDISNLKGERYEGYVIQYHSVFISNNINNKSSMLKITKLRRKAERKKEAPNPDNLQLSDLVEGKRERKMKRLLVMKKQNGRPFNSTTCFAFSAAYGLAVEVTELVRLHPQLQRLHRGFQIWASFHRPATGVSGVFSKQDNHHWTSLLENFQVL
ncbi:uncharacterized protein LOC130717446 [Lotus japonicus]|uniref:uncharacterized protein LOC130717446 n=1 Tax=Lotus japonicus TaxID=34305 RepID=UPI002589663A|nr:uncharacterized protein LOC130717446 [Lotus japonicus]